MADELQRLYPSVNVIREAEVAKFKIERGIVNKKTARGMAKFLSSWMDRAQNSARPNQQPAKAPLSGLPAHCQPAIDLWNGK
jgi:hypothetical protein